MEKVWFKLRQTHYPPGPEERILAGDGDDTKTPICLGHIIPDLKHIDFPINGGEVVAFPARMTVFKSESIHFKWHDGQRTGWGFALGAGGTIAAALGLVSVKASIRFAFQRSVDEYEEFERLDTYFVQPNRPYVEQCLRMALVKDHVEDKKDWSFFIITGIKVARAGKRSTRAASGTETGGGPQVKVPAVATAEATAQYSNEAPRETEEGNMSDFIWAVRLAKVHKGVLMTDWSLDPFTHRATFGVGDEDEVDLGLVIKDEGLENFKVIDDEEAGEAVVMDDVYWKEES
ncbi:hypothetical protein CP533_3732 [Ophiocordyceps camponoti-saundersi (nom. inval.)]|nr:hypothetical protein CP533_3732 [Ophiocordyceps camponoti-saundersi (nom. inval.)]